MKKETFPVGGMMCASCASVVERALRRQPGVEEADVNLAGRSVLLTYDETKTSPKELKAAVDKTGYELVLADECDMGREERRRLILLSRKVIVSWILSLVVMGLSMGWFSVGSRDWDNQTMLIITFFVMAYSGRQFYRSAWRQLLRLSANMDSLVALSTAVSFLFSVTCTFFGDRVWTPLGIEWHTYFDATAMIITFVLTGRLLEERARISTASSIRALMALSPKSAHLVSAADTTAVSDVPLSTVRRGDCLEVREGEKIPVDGMVTFGEGRVDESMISGEPAAVDKREGARVLAGTISRGGVFRLKALQVGETTVLASIIRAVREAQGSKAPVQRVVDRVALFFVPAVMALSVLTFVLWISIGGSEETERAILSSVSVLVIACPCALGLATPTALMVGIGKAAQKNILIRDATALEQLRRVNAVVIDKTGTLTVLSRDSEGGESLKPHAREAMEMLKSEGIEVYMMSGDSEERAALEAKAASIDHWRSLATPEDKEETVRRLQRQGKTVAMVGDGVNDSPALAAADVSVAMAKGTDVAIKTAQVTLMGDDLRRIPDAIDLSRRTVAMIRENLLLAFIYNIVCIPLAAGILYPFGVDFQITPMYASALMALSSVSVVTNSLRLKSKDRQ